MKKSTLLRIAFVCAFLSVITIFFIFDLQQYLSLTSLKEQQASLQETVRNNFVTSASIYLIIYISVTSLSLPGAAIMTIGGGAIFGLLWGTILVSFASSIGATLAFLAARFALRNWINEKFGDKLATFNEGIKNEGAFYLFGLRLVPIFPFFLINMVSGLTSMSALTFYWVSQLGMLPGTIVYVNAGTQLASIESLQGIVSPNVLFSFIALGLLPILTKWIMKFLRKTPSISKSALKN